MTLDTSSFQLFAQNYIQRLNQCFTQEFLLSIEELSKALYDAWANKQNVYVCGNGGSAANALHMANDLHYGTGHCGSGLQIPGLRVEALPANIGIVTCLANDIGYEHIYSNQLKAKASKNDLLIVLSGSGNSKNVINAILTAKELDVKSFAIVSFTGGECMKLADRSIYSPINDMQIAEDLQLIVGHLCMQWLSEHKPST